MESANWISPSYCSLIFSALRLIQRSIPRLASYFRLNSLSWRCLNRFAHCFTIHQWRNGTNKWTINNFRQHWLFHLFVKFFRKPKDNIQRLPKLKGKKKHHQICPNMVFFFTQKYRCFSQRTGNLIKNSFTRWNTFISYSSFWLFIFSLRNHIADLQDSCGHFSL